MSKPRPPTDPCNTVTVRSTALRGEAVRLIVLKRARLAGIKGT